MKKIIIAIDGPAAAGKSTVAKLVAKRLGYDYLDTGAMYRCCTLKVLNSGVSVDDEEAIKELLKDTKMECSEGSWYIDGENVSERIREQDVTLHVSKVCAYPSVRVSMADKQREIGRNGGYVLDGREIGTYVFPNAELKIYQTADIDVRANRRYQEYLSKGKKVTFEEIKADIMRRDHYDSNRELAPLKKADDAIEIDTSLMNAEEVANKIVELTMKVVGGEQ